VLDLRNWENFDQLDDLVEWLLSIVEAVHKVDKEKKAARVEEKAKKGAARAAGVLATPDGRKRAGNTPAGSPARKRNTLR